MAQDDKPEFKVTITIAAHEQETLDQLIEALQAHMVENGLEAEGRIRYETPLEYRKRASLASGTPMDKVWKNETGSFDWKIEAA